MIQPQTLTFLRGIKKHNDKEWFEYHKDDYKAAQAHMKELLFELASEIAKFDPKVKRALKEDGSVVKTFRIYRDVRFSKDKTKYKTNLSGFVAADLKDPTEPVYYLSIEPGGKSFFGGGLHMPERLLLGDVRDYIVEHPKQLAKVEADKDFKKQFPNILSRDRALKTVPRGYDIEHEAVHYLQLQSYIAGKNVPDTMLKNKKLVQEISQSAKALYPLINFIRKAT